MGSTSVGPYFNLDNTKYNTKNKRSRIYGTYRSADNGNRTRFTLISGKPGFTDFSIFPVFTGHFYIQSFYIYTSNLPK